MLDGFVHTNINGFVKAGAGVSGIYIFVCEAMEQWEFCGEYKVCACYYYYYLFLKHLCYKWIGFGCWAQCWEKDRERQRGRGRGENRACILQHHHPECAQYGWKSIQIWIEMVGLILWRGRYIIYIIYIRVLVAFVSLSSLFIYYFESNK